MSNVKTCHIPLKEFLELLGSKSFKYELSPMGLWAAFLDGKVVCYLSFDVTPESVLNDDDLVMTKDPIYGYYIERKPNLITKTIKDIYLGLPNNLKDKVMWVDRDYRTHPWSFEPGGHDIVVEFSTGEVLGYDWIKSPNEYINKIVSERAGFKIVQYKKLNVKDKIHIYKNFVYSIYIRTISYDKNGNKIVSDFIEKWTSQNDNLPDL
jgi:hypothetical protein